MNPGALVWAPFFHFFSIVFAAQVTRLLQGETTMARVVVSGMLTLAVPLDQAITYVPYILGAGQLQYEGPIPVQLIVRAADCIEV